MAPTSFILLLLCSLQFVVGVLSWGSSDKVRLTDIQTLTLYHGRMTTARRTQPVPQLKCVGGSAGCHSFVPQVVQCSNKGSDGFDVQWECKSDMDNTYRFGFIEVVCEGYDYPDDPYVLKGSCGLEYNLDFTKEGFKNQKNNNHHNYYGDTKSTNWNTGFYNNKKSPLGDVVILIIVGVMIYAIYRTCISNNQFSSTNDDYPDAHDRFGSSGNGSSSYGRAPPPPGFRPEYNADGDCSRGSSYPRGSGSGSGGGGFWTGAATGGLLGYLFGSRNTGYNTYTNGYQSGYQRPHYSSNSWGNSGFGGFSSGYSSESTGTRTASGFGGTRRR